ncbi:iron response transcriptional regulator IrrA [Methylovirgula sp. HY1]|uniref:iron response transcriptional regulator IrrA n=1 Tax=Methylovirgula sp. HY1 TaxID=2822761 RepID=UPI001C793955|nr:transcriptional repressor [Methylovirgula sp. HY1]QXX76079.1 Ferric uptake regulation protein [Methylovirgula sp. HY1]
MLKGAYQTIPVHMHRRRLVAELRAPNVRALLNHCSIRPTRQRLSLASLLFSKGNRHVTAEGLLAEARAACVQASYATIYNVLKCFSDAGLLRCLAVEGHPMIFDTNTGPHHHFFFEDSAEITDLAFGDVAITGLPQPPEGYEIAKVDVVVRLRPKKKVKPANG